MIIKQQPETNTNLIRYCGELITFSVEIGSTQIGTAFLRTNIDRGKVRLKEIIRHAEEGLPPLDRDWHDIPMIKKSNGNWEITLLLNYVGRYEAKVYFRTSDEKFHWPLGKNTIIKVEPPETIKNNTMYTAFVRLFGSAREQNIIQAEQKVIIDKLSDADYSVLPPSGTFRDLIKELDFIIGHLRCNIIQLLPIHPTPTTYARMGQYGSPFAALDLMDVDPALAEFDRARTPLDQFQELVDSIHMRNANIYLDMPINHTGWASHLQNHHPDWFARDPDNENFSSPGAWGVVWEDLSKLDYSHRELWNYMAKVFLFWCKKGVDGFRCDAGYKVPLSTWRYIIAKVRLEYPNTVFMLEGLGGDPALTEKLLDEGGMNWAYSEIFQNYDRNAIENYLPNSLLVSKTKGNLIHFAETHDNNRLAETSPTFAKLRTALCALTSNNGSFGFSNGLEWLATEKINVHNAHSLNWNNPNNQIEWIRRLHIILEIHPAFSPTNEQHIVTDGSENIIIILRYDSEKRNKLLILANLSLNKTVEIPHKYNELIINLLDETNLDLPFQPGEIRCLTDDVNWKNKIEEKLKESYEGSEYAEKQRLKANLSKVEEAFNIPIVADCKSFLEDPIQYCKSLTKPNKFVKWDYTHDHKRTVMIPPNHALIVRVEHRFIFEIHLNQKTIVHEKSFQIDDDSHALIIEPLESCSHHQTLKIHLTIFNPNQTVRVKAPILLLCNNEDPSIQTLFRINSQEYDQRLAICTNKKGALTQVRSAWSSLKSKYDGILQANLHSAVPIDRHILFTRCRMWVQRNGFSTELNQDCQTHFGTNTNSKQIFWHFNIPVGQGFIMPLTITLRMHDEINAVEFQIERRESLNHPEFLSNNESVDLIIRPDIEDRVNHGVTKVSDSLKNHFMSSVNFKENGFNFTPDINRQLIMECPDSTFESAPEWYFNVQHPIDKTRNTDGSSDLFSPGFFKLSLSPSKSKKLTASVNDYSSFKDINLIEPKPQPLEELLKYSIDSFIVQRNQLKTIIAGYPWFLDWGRDTLICLRGVIASGRYDEAKSILIAFAKLERKGTLPNMISGDDHANRETSDAPLWLFIACQDLLKSENQDKLLESDCDGRSLLDVLISIADNYIKGTENGIYMDHESALIFSPSHYTWMDTNYPACTPREGYPIEIQSLWFAALKFLSIHEPSERWKILFKTVSNSIEKYFIVQKNNERYLADLLLAKTGVPAKESKQDKSIRPNQLFAITLGVIGQNSLANDILTTTEKLLVPGAIRSLADEPVNNYISDYHDNLDENDRNNPYQGIYIGDEDSQRKPAYHNGTAWTWPFPSFVEALLITYGSDLNSQARALLSSASILLENGCIGHLPEILDGNTPHYQRGCAAQAWGATELYRVWRLTS